MICVIIKFVWFNKLQDDYKTELCSLKKQLKESQENQSNTDIKVNNLLANIRTLQEEKKSLEAKLTQKQASYQAQVNLFISISLYILYILSLC